MEKSRDRIVFESCDALEKVKRTPSHAETAGEAIIKAALDSNGHAEKITETKTPEYTTAVDANSEKMAMLIMAAEFEKLEIAFNNAGVGATYTGIYDMNAAINDRQIALNLTGQFYSIKYELRQFLKQISSNR